MEIHAGVVYKRTTLCAIDIQTLLIRNVALRDIQLLHRGVSPLSVPSATLELLLLRASSGMPGNSLANINGRGFPLTWRSQLLFPSRRLFAQQCAERGVNIYTIAEHRCLYMYNLSCARG